MATNRMYHYRTKEYPGPYVQSNMLKWCVGLVLSMENNGKYKYFFFAKMVCACMTYLKMDAGYCVVKACIHAFHFWKIIMMVLVGYKISSNLETITEKNQF